MLVVGAGGREHAIVKKLHKDAEKSGRSLQLFAAPGNPGIAELATCVPIEAEDVRTLRDFARKEAMDLTIVGPEVPLVHGIVDLFQDVGLRIFGPSRDAARIESSKAFARQEMIRAGVPSPRYDQFTDLHSAMAFIQKQDPPIVVKADGLAAGKGVTVAHSIHEAEQALRHMMLAKTFGSAGDTVIIEQYLRGREISVMAFFDESGFCMMPAAQDHKPIGNGDEGPNTGGMGTVSPVYFATDHMMNLVRDHIFTPMYNHFRRIGLTYRGVLFAGIMVLNNMPFVIEFNARFGDPETQVVLERLETDLLEIIEAILEDRVASLDVKWSQDAAVCVVLSAQGYPGGYRKGDPIEGLDQVKAMESLEPGPAKLALVPDPPPAPKGWRRFLKREMSLEPKPSAPEPTVRPVYAYPLHAGTMIGKDGKLVTNGGRVLNVVGRGPTLREAREKAYEAAARVRFNGKYYRTDIGERRQ